MFSRVGESMSQNGTNKIMIDCPACKQRFSAPAPKTSIINDLSLSMAFATHDKPVRCLCGKFLVVVITRAEISWGAVPIDDEQAGQLGESKIVTPPPGLRVH